MPEHVADPSGRLARLAPLFAALLVGMASCGDDPFAFEWDDAPDTVQLYALGRSEFNLPSGFNFYEDQTVRVEDPGATGSWDVAVDTLGGNLVFLPPGALGITARARIATLPGIRFDDLREAPEDTAVYEADLPAIVDGSTVYVVSTNRRVGSFGSSCIYYAKVEPLTFDVLEGVLTFRYVSSPLCNNREFVSPD